MSVLFPFVWHRMVASPSRVACEVGSDTGVLADNTIKLYLGQPLLRCAGVACSLLSTKPSAQEWEAAVENATKTPANFMSFLTDYPVLLKLLDPVSGDTLLHAILSIQRLFSLELVTFVIEKTPLSARSYTNANGQTPFRYWLSQNFLSNDDAVSAIADKFDINKELGLTSSSLPYPAIVWHSRMMAHGNTARVIKAQICKGDFLIVLASKGNLPSSIRELTDMLSIYTGILRDLNTPEYRHFIPTLVDCLTYIAEGNTDAEKLVKSLIHGVLRLSSTPPAELYTYSAYSEAPFLFKLLQSEPVRVPTGVDQLRLHIVAEYPHMTSDEVTSKLWGLIEQSVSRDGSRFEHILAQSGRFDLLLNNYLGHSGYANTMDRLRRISDGKYPTHMAVENGNAETAKIFLKQCPAMASLRDSEGRTILHAVVETRKPVSVAVLLKEDCVKALIECENNKGQTAIHVAAKLGLVTTLGYLLAVTNTVSGLLKPDLKGNTVFHLAAKTGNRSVIETYGDHVTDWQNRQNKKGQIPAMLALQAGHIMTLRSLGLFDPHSRDFSGKNFLHYGVDTHQLAMCLEAIKRIHDMRPAQSSILGLFGLSAIKHPSFVDFAMQKDSTRKSPVEYAVALGSPEIAMAIINELDTVPDSKLRVLLLAVSHAITIQDLGVFSALMRTFECALSRDMGTVFSMLIQKCRVTESGGGVRKADVLSAIDTVFCDFYGVIQPYLNKGVAVEIVSGAGFSAAVESHLHGRIDSAAIS